MSRTVEEISAKINELKDELISNYGITLETLKILFPKVKNNQATTGTIPIDAYYKYEEEISAICIKERLQRFYRGPRHKDNATRTRKADATGVVLYRKL